MEPLISAVMPTYNSEKYVAEAVESILSQSFGDFEFLIVNEYGSDDATCDIIGSFHDPRIRVIQNTKRLGVADSLNEGIRQAKGKYIARMDSDDISLPDRFQKQVAFMEANPEIAICGGWMQCFGKFNHIIKTPELHEEIHASLLFFNYICHSTVLLRRAEIIKHHLWYNPAFAAEDYELWARAVKKVKFANFQEILGYYRFSDLNTSIANKELFIEQEQEIFARSLRELGIAYKQDYPPHLVCDSCGSLERVPREQWKERLTQIKRLFFDIMARNSDLNIYDEKALSRHLHGKYVSSFYMGKCFYEEDAVSPFAYFADELVEDLEAKAGDQRICLMGMGGIGQTMLPHVKRRFGGRLVCVSDNDPDKWGTSYEGVLCKPPDDVPRDLCVVITARHNHFVEIHSGLEHMGFACILPYVSLF